jgi:hypothetical protein
MIDQWSAFRGLLRWEQRAKLLPLRVGERRQTGQTHGIMKHGVRRRCLARTALHVAVPGHSLMHPPETRPPQPVLAQGFWLAEGVYYATQFGDTELQARIVDGAFFSGAFA